MYLPSRMGLTHDWCQPNRLGWNPRHPVSADDLGHWRKLWICILELHRIWLSLEPWTLNLQGHQIRIVSDNTTAVACVNHQGRIRCDVASKKLFRFWYGKWAGGLPQLTRSELLRRISPPGDIFNTFCHRWGTPDMSLLASRFNRLRKFCLQVQEPSTQCSGWFLLFHGISSAPLRSRAFQWCSLHQTSPCGTPVNMVLRTHQAFDSLSLDFSKQPGSFVP